MKRDYLSNVRVTPERDGGATVFFIRPTGKSRRVWVSEERAGQLHIQLSKLGYNCYPVWSNWEGLRELEYTNRGQPYGIAYGYGTAGLFTEMLHRETTEQLERAVEIMEAVRSITDGLDNLYEEWEEEINALESFVREYRRIQKQRAA